MFLLAVQHHPTAMFGLHPAPRWANEAELGRRGRTRRLPPLSKGVYLGAQAIANQLVRGMTTRRAASLGCAEAPGSDDTTCDVHALFLGRLSRGRTGGRSRDRAPL